MNIGQEIADGIIAGLTHARTAEEFRQPTVPVEPTVAQAVAAVIALSLAEGPIQ